MHLHIDPVGGVAGDMLLAALVDAGADAEAIACSLAPVADPDSIRFRGINRRGITGTILAPKAALDRRVLAREKDLPPILARLPISRKATEQAERVFRRILSAESSIHGTPLDETHLHEVAALDTLVDLVGTAVALEKLGCDSVSCGPVPLGNGTVETEHGLLPAPAPATVKILEGIAVCPGGGEGEMTTPTGAALIAEIVNRPNMPTMTLLKSGVGFGAREGGPLPNCLRVFLGETEREEEIVMLQANIDDMTPEAAGRLASLLMESGALDAGIVPMTMKKGRPGWMLTVLAERGLESALADRILLESSTIGVRYIPVGRIVCERKIVTVDLDGHPCRIKVASHRNEEIRASVEFDDADAIARETGAALRDVMNRALALYHASRGEPES